ncbi:zona pellucida protein alpha, partial [Vibrio splendidus]
SNPSNPIEGNPSNPIEGTPSNPIEDSTPSNPIEGDPSNPIEGTTTPAELREKIQSLSQEQRQQIKQAVKDRASRS